MQYFEITAEHVLTLNMCVCIYICFYACLRLLLLAKRDREARALTHTNALSLMALLKRRRPFTHCHKPKLMTEHAPKVLDEFFFFFLLIRMRL